MPPSGHTCRWRVRATGERARQGAGAAGMDSGRGRMREREQTKIQLSVVQIIAGALASVSAALVASTFGLKGTLLGAAITSIVASVGGALYSHSLHRARARIQTRFNPHTGAIERVVIRPPRARRPIRWGRVAGVAGLVFVLAMGAITVVEVAARRPVAALVG